MASGGPWSANRGLGGTTGRPEAERLLAGLLCVGALLQPLHGPLERRAARADLSAALGTGEP